MSAALPSMSNTMLRMAVSTEVREPQNPLSSGTNLQDSAPLADLDVERAIVTALRASGLSESEACRLTVVEAKEERRQRPRLVPAPDEVAAGVLA
jgi:hypothetical protein